MADGSERSNSHDGDAASTVYERITDAVFALDEEWQFTFLNAQAEQVLERSEADLLGTTIWEGFPDAVDSAFQREYERAMDAQEPVAFQEFSEPLDAWLEVRAYPSETGLTVYLRDITEQIRRQKRLQKREQALHDAYEVIADPQRAFRDQIDELLAVVRRTIGTTYATLSRVHEDTNEYIFEAVDAPTNDEIEAGDTAPLAETSCEHTVSTEETLVLRDVEVDAPELADRAATAEWGISCYLGTPITVDDEVYGTFCFYDMEARSEAFTDWEVTFVELLGNWVSYELERERYQRKLEESNERLERFAYTASHDLQEPLRMITSYLGLIDQRYGDELDADATEFLEFAVDGAGRMTEMIDGLLTYSRVETRGDPFEPVELDAVLADVRDDLQFRIEETDAELSSKSLPRVEGDPDQLRQVFQNLISNALEYSGDEPPRIRVSAERTGSNWTVSISDEGIGIDPDDAERIFEVFERLHSHEEHPGTGIGLALCKRIVERHDGEIWVDSESDEGATVQFTLPVLEAAE
ncbi:sensor histidine kinase [Natronorubrum sp. DTA28]|uniref:sensor histidine kinase n=1 Tax=Natronorubrum sp. DTA28 TaxID=3447019 RepID=UPI003F83E8A9